MTTTTQDRISKISDEVKDLHPLLEALFQDHPQITSVDYTHGSHEMGADFVLTRIHEVLRTQQWIGVIAKTGKIHQDLGDLVRQIDECTVPRLVEGGKKRITISEVWVVATSTITLGAQTRLHDKFKSSNIQFIDGRKLSAMIDEHLPHYMSDLPLTVSTYLADMHARVEETDKRVQLVYLGDGPLFIEQDVQRIEHEPYVQNKNAKPPKVFKVDFVSEVVDRQALLLEAGMGGGKSKQLRRLAIHYATATHFSDTHILPILTSLKEVLDAYSGDLSSLISSVVPEAVHAEVDRNDGKYLVLVDAVDEKELEHGVLLETIDSLLHQASAREDLTVVFASRFISNPDFDRHFLRRLNRYELRPLTLGRILQFLKAVCDNLNLEARIVDDLRRSPLFARLPHSPIAALLLAQLLNQTREELPATMTELYTKFIELALGRWDMEKGLMSQQEYEVTETVLGDIARYMLENELEVVALSEFRQRIESYLQTRNLAVSVDNIVHHALTRCDVLVSYPENGTIGFKHRSFAEFLCAKHMARNTPLEADERAWDLYWTNVYFFTLGLAKDAPDLLTALIKTKADLPGRQLYKPLALGDYMLAAYATPYHVIEQGVKVASLESAQFFIDIRNSTAATPFVGMSVMHVLYFFQLVFRDRYGYAFFTRALESAALSIATEGTNADRDAHALFFLAVAAIEAGNGEGFRFLLDDYREQLPLDVSLAVLHEAGSDKMRSKLIKKLRRRLRDHLKGNKALQAHKDRLYDRMLPAITANK